MEVLFRRIDEHGKQAHLADSIGMDAGDFSGWKNSRVAMKISHLAALLVELNLKLVDADAKCVKPSTFHELTQLAAKALREQPQLLWDDE